MACGVPILTTNEAVIESLSPELRTRLAVTPADRDQEAEALFRAISWDERARNALAADCRSFIMSNHSLVGLFDKMLGEIAGGRHG